MSDWVHDILICLLHGVYVENSSVLASVSYQTMPS